MKKGQSVAVAATGARGVITAILKAEHRAPFYVVRGNDGRNLGAFTRGQLK